MPSTTNFEHNLRLTDERGILFVSAINNFGVSWYSSDFGNTWQATRVAGSVGFTNTVSKIQNQYFSLGDTFNRWNGTSWNSLSYINFTSIDSISNFLVMGMNSGVGISSDLGASWNLSTSGIPTVSGVQTVYKVIKLGNTWLASTGAGVYKSTNEGTSWATSRAGNDTNAILKIDESTAFATDYGVGFIRTTDGGNTWALKNPPSGAPFEAYSGEITYPAALHYENGKLYAIYESGTAWSTDLGENGNYTPNPDDPGPWACWGANQAMKIHNSKVYFSTTTKGLAYTSLSSYESGNPTWNYFSKPDGLPESLCGVTVIDEKLFVPTPSGVYVGPVP